MVRDAEGNWTRCECTDESLDEPSEMIAIDYGISSPAMLKDIRRLPKKLAFPCFSIICLLKGNLRVNPHTSLLIQSHSSSLCSLPSDVPEQVNYPELMKLLALNASFVAEEAAYDAESSLTVLEVSDILKRAGQI